MARVLVADDDASVAYTLRASLESAGHDVETAPDGAAALEKLGSARPFDALVTDLAMPRMDGMALLHAARAADPTLAVVMITAVGDERAAVEAMKRGAFDYFKKPFDVDEVEAVVEKAAETTRMRRELQRLRARGAAPEGAVFASAAMQRLRETAERVAGKDVTVLFVGETGTGKEVLADLVQAKSRRAGGPYVKYHCGAVPETLAESELFGHERGAFTNALRAQRGVFPRAHGGTLFLDEVGDVAPAVQGKLLRALQQGEIQPLGADEVRRVDVRVLAATRKDLPAEVAAERFREDLYFRLNVIVLRVPPLAERREDVAPLARRFLAQAALKFGMAAPPELEPEALDLLVRRDWPGNVRELENACERLVALAAGPITPDDVGALGGEPRPPSAAGAERPSDFRRAVDAFEKQLLERALADAGGNHAEAARKLGLPRVTLLDRLRRHGLR
jgi:DNA-binding NtrC family response regulator